MPDQEYYRSERFIWDNLKTKASRGISSLYQAWKAGGKIQPFLISWPSEPVLGDDGLPTANEFLLELPDNRSSWSKAMRNFSSRTKSYALLLTEQLTKELRVTLESHHGTRSWSIPIVQSGDVRMLGEPIVQDNVHKIGILWSVRQQSD